MVAQSDELALAVLEQDVWVQLVACFALALVAENIQNIQALIDVEVDHGLIQSRPGLFAFRATSLGGGPVSRFRVARSGRRQCTLRA